jgi:hypothetical protein
LAQANGNEIFIAVCFSRRIKEQTIFFSNQRLPDYWFERGYDYFSGL